jgi:hypothetical protein
MPTLEGLLRQVVSNRRRHRRRRLVYETDLKNDRNQIIFRGKTIDISRSGARLVGLPVSAGAQEGDSVLVEITVPPQEVTGPMQRLYLSARIVRIDETVDSYSIGVIFDKELSE